MKQKMSKKTIIGIIVLVLFAGAIGVFGYRVIATSGELPGRLMSVSTAVSNLEYSGYTMARARKIEYNKMKYGYMDDVFLAQMDYLDRYYEGEQMEAVRAVNNLTAMSEKTANKLAYEAAKAEQEKAVREAEMAALEAEKARQQKLKELAAKIREQAAATAGGGTEGSGDTRSNGGRKGEPVYASSHGKSLGQFVITAYCTCKICCGIYSGGNRTASGTVPTTNRTLAVDTDVIPFKTKLVINGQIYVAEDRGSAIKGKRIDMFFYTHKEATQWGRKTIEVFLAD